MSLINQVLKDLDSREPLNARPAIVNNEIKNNGNSGSSIDWLRLLVWGVTGFLVVALVLYSYLVERYLPEVVTIKPASTGVVAVAETEPASLTVEEPGSKLDEVKFAIEQHAIVAAESPVKEHVKVDQPKVSKDIAYLPLIDSSSHDEVLQEASIQKVVRQTAIEPEIVVTKAVKSSIAIARNLIKAGKLIEAEKELQEIIRSKPSDINARELLIGLLLRNDRTAEASGQITEALKFYPNRENLVLMQARTLLAEKQVDAAISVLQKQITTKKAGSKTLAMLAPLYQQQFRYEESVRVYSQLLKQIPSGASYWVGLAISLEALARQGEAFTAYQNALKTGGLPASLQQYAMQRINILNQQGQTHE